MLVTSLFPLFLFSYFIIYVAVDSIKFLSKNSCGGFVLWIRLSLIVVISIYMELKDKGNNKFSNCTVHKKINKAGICHV